MLLSGHFHAIIQDLIINLGTWEFEFDIDIWGRYILIYRLEYEVDVVSYLLVTNYPFTLYLSKSFLLAKSLFNPLVLFYAIYNVKVKLASYMYTLHASVRLESMVYMHVYVD